MEVADAFGPEYVVRVKDVALGMEGFLVIHNTALGPGKGGIRMAASVTEEEVRRLARAMTWKNSLAGLPFGGAKSGIVWPGGDDEKKRAFLQSFARAIKMFTPKKYIGAPDVNTGEREMAWFVGATGNWRSATGKPANLCMASFGEKGEKCGIPHEFGSTGFGVAHAAKVAAELVGIPLKGATVAIHGFGNVGTFTYQFLTEMGARVVALADVYGAVHAKNGFPKDAVMRVIKNRTPLTRAFAKHAIAPEKFWSVPVDILIPASVTDVIHAGNKNDIQTKIIIEAGNIPMREPIENDLWKKGIMIVPDFVANAGGVISSYAEYRGYNPKRMFELVERKITEATSTVMKESIKSRRNPRRVALEIAQQRVENAMKK